MLKQMFITLDLTPGANPNDRFYGMRSEGGLASVKDKNWIG
jgi:hypothetical protein